MTAVIINFVLTGIALFIAGKFVDAEIRLVDAIICAAVSALLLFIPGAGGLISIVVFFMLLKYFTECDIWPDLVLLVVVSKIVVVIASLYYLKLA